MPFIKLPLPETHMSVSRPVTLTVIRDLDRLMQLGIADNQIPIQFLGRTTSQFQLNSDVTRPTVDNQSNMIKTDNSGKITISVNEQYDENTILTTHMHGGNTSKSVFFDPALSIGIKPIYSSTKVIIDVSYRAEDLRAVEAWRDRVRLAIASDRLDTVHAAEYKYPIPREFLVILHDLYRVRELNAGYGDTFKSYFDSHRSDKFTTITTQAGTEPILAIEEIQENIAGYFDFTEVPKEDRADHHPLWVINFQYVFTYDKPIHARMQYPLVIHNQIIPTHLRDTEDDTMYSRMVGHRSLTNEWMDRIRTISNFYNGRLPGVKIPYYDEWWVNKDPINTLPIVTFLCGITPDNRREINSIVDFHYFKMLDSVIPYFTKYKDRLLEPNFSPFIFSVYCGDERKAIDTFFIDENLVLQSKYDLSLRLTYHLRISILTDLSLLSTDGKNAIGEYPPIAQDVVDFIYPEVVLETIKDGALISGPDWDKVVSKNRPPKQLLRNVGYFLINTSRN
jgi:hypothetical protein